MQKDMIYQELVDISLIKNLSINLRIANQIAAENIVNPKTGEIMVEKDEKIDRETAVEIQNAGINVVDIQVEDKVIRVIGNNFVDINKVC